MALDLGQIKFMKKSFGLDPIEILACEAATASPVSWFLVAELPSEKSQFVSYLIHIYDLKREKNVFVYVVFAVFVFVVVVFFRGGGGGLHILKLC